ncbi:hypothetical protein GCM10020218_104220 [Dactylosporangium vinaceum]
MLRVDGVQQRLHAAGSETSQAANRHRRTQLLDEVLGAAAAARQEHVPGAVPGHEMARDRAAQRARAPVMSTPCRRRGAGPTRKPGPG